MESERTIENHNELKMKTKSEFKTNGITNANHSGKENSNPNLENKEESVRRHDEPSELSFEICKEIL